MWVPLSFPQHGRRAQIPIGLLPHQSPAAALVHYLPTRFRALALFGRRSRERVVRSSLPAAENLHTSGLVHRSKKHRHSINSSARSRNDSGIVSPIALAVLRLMTSSNLVGCSTGMSPGLVPRSSATICRASISR